MTAIDLGNLVLKQGSRNRFVIGVTGIDSLSGFSARAMIRPNRSINASLLADFSTSVTVDAANNQVSVDINGATSSAWNWDRGVYDIEVYKAGPPEEVYRVAEGNVTLSREVTR